MAKEHPTEDQLMAFLDTMEKSTGGGDALQSASHDGGFATEGTNIQAQAKKMQKALIKSGYSVKEANALVAKAFPPGGDDDSSSEEEIEKGDDDSMSEEDTSGDEGSDEDEGENGPPMPPMAKGKMKKSLGASQLDTASKRREHGALRKALVEENPDMEGAFDAAPILMNLVTSIDNLVSRNSGGINKSVVSDLRKSIQNVQTVQNAFNTKLAKGLSMIAQLVIDQGVLVKAMHDQPVVQNRAVTMRKSDVLEPGFHHGQTQFDSDAQAPQRSPLYGVEFLKIQEALVDICMKGQGATIDNVTMFENSKGDLNLLPPNVVKQLEQRLCAAA